MMAAKNKQKVVLGKDDLRRLMKEKQTAASKEKRIESPLARYNSIGQLSCVLCNCPIKSNLLWNAHTQGRTHKESIARLKEEKETKSAAFVKPLPSSGSKRKSSDGNNSIPTKAIKGKQSSGETKRELPADFFDSSKDGATKGKYASATSTTSSAPTGLASYDSSSDEEEDGASVTPTPTIGATGSVASESRLPEDFFDADVAATSSGAPTVDPVISKKLPEGFFDDPKMDAKVRKVEYKDKMEEEWELFQKTMKEQNQVSEVIMDEEDEAVNVERNIAEIDEQLHKWSQINELAKRKEKIMAQEVDPREEQSDEDEVDDQQYEEFLDWRSKKVWK